MNLYEYGRIITKAQGKLNKIMYQYHYDKLEKVDAERQAYEVVKNMEKEIFDYEHYHKVLNFTKEMIGE